MSSTLPPSLNPAQQEVLDLLGASPEERPTFDPGLRDDLQAELEDGLAEIAPELEPDKPLWVSKRDLATVHGCELRHLAEGEAGFSWSAGTARGAVAHKAIELSIHWPGEPDPLEMVDEAMARLANGGDGLADWLQTCGEAERAELRAAANERVVTFLECFPPLKAKWRPVTEGRLRANLLGGRVVLAGRTDLSLGRSIGTTAGKVIIDLKTGGHSPSHLDDLRFYALVETLRLGTPPRLLASYYLDAGRAQPEAVTEGLLRAAVARTIDGAHILHQLEVGTREPQVRPGPMCRWCPALHRCGPGRAHLGEDDPNVDLADAD
ncbi:MAG TPA: PD-(D/E)XK nuclease family protein [Acidimicrobiales bacterium]